MDMKKVYAYIRTSTTFQDVDKQRYVLGNYAIKKSIKIDKWFIDGGVSGMIPMMERRMMRNMLQDIKNGGDKRYVILSTEVSRISRDTEDIRNTLAPLLKTHKVDFIFVFDNTRLEWSEEVVDKLANLASFAEQEGKIISKRTKEALKSMREQGVRLGNPNGFTAEAQDKATATKRALAANNANNKQSKAAAQELRSQGVSIPDIVRYLSANGYKTSRGLEHNYMSVSRLLK